MSVYDRTSGFARGQVIYGLVLLVAAVLFYLAPSAGIGFAVACGVSSVMMGLLTIFGRE